MVPERSALPLPRGARGRFAVARWDRGSAATWALADRSHPQETGLASDHARCSTAGPAVSG